MSQFVSVFQYPESLSNTAEEKGILKLVGVDMVGLRYSTESACVTCMKPWVQSLALSKLGMTPIILAIKIRKQEDQIFGSSP